MSRTRWASTPKGEEHCCPVYLQASSHWLVSALLNQVQQVTFVIARALEIQGASAHFSTFPFSPSACSPVLRPVPSGLPGNGSCLPSGRRLHHSPSQQPDSSESCSQPARLTQAVSGFAKCAGQSLWNSCLATSFSFSAGIFLHTVY